MTKTEAAQLLSIIKWSYPNAYRNISDQDAAAVCRLWQLSFRDVPYRLMEYAVHEHIMHCKYPPTVAEIADILGTLHAQAQETYYLARQHDPASSAVEYQQIMNITARFTANPQTERFLPLTKPELLYLIDGSADG